MTTDEHIQKLIEHRDFCLRTAYKWMSDAQAKRPTADGKLSLVKEIGEYESWIATAKKVTEMIDALKPMRVVKTPAAPKRGRHLNLA